MKHALGFLWLLPRNVCVVILRAYRAVISPLYGDVCRYYPSCSAYALGAIQQHGVVKGIALGSWRIARCHPWAKGGVDDVPEHPHPHPTTRFGFVLTTSHGKA
ncbi:MAG: membrane protein insertion efficiency factor YidD [Pseudolysinimonas sp.]